MIATCDHVPESSWHSTPKIRPTGIEIVRIGVRAIRQQPSILLCMLQHTLPSPSIANVNLLPAIWNHHNFDTRATLQGRSASKLQQSPSIPEVLGQTACLGSGYLAVLQQPWVTAHLHPCRDPAYQLCLRYAARRVTTTQQIWSDLPVGHLPQHPNRTLQLLSAVLSRSSASQRISCRLRTIADSGISSRCLCSGLESCWITWSPDVSGLLAVCCPLVP